MLPTHYILHNISYRVFKKIFVFFEFLKILVTCLFFPWKLKSICKNQILTKQTLYSNCLVGPWHPQSSPVLHRRALMGSASPKVTHNYPGLPPTSQLLYNIFFSDPFEILYGGQYLSCELMYEILWRSVHKCARTSSKRARARFIASARVYESCAHIYARIFIKFDT